MRHIGFGLLAAGMLVGLAVAAPVPKATKPPVGETNTNALVAKHKDKLKIEATSEWAQWPVTNLLDDNEQSSWYSNTPDNTTAGQCPVITVTFPEDVSIKRVSIRGNRDPQYLTNYFVHEGSIELVDAAGKTIATHDLKAAGEKYDFDLILGKYTTVRAVRFKATKSDNGSCGLGEFQVE